MSDSSWGGEDQSDPDEDVLAGKEKHRHETVGGITRRNHEPCESEPEKTAYRRDAHGFGEHESENLTIGETYRLEQREFAGPLSHRQGHGVPHDQKNREERGP